MLSANLSDKEKRSDANLHTSLNESKPTKDNLNPVKLENSNTTPTTSKPSKPPASNPPKTPVKTSAKKHGTPNSVPLRPRPGRVRPEPSLLEDFLLGRTGLNRIRNVPPARRASLEAVKADMKSEYVAKLQGPSKVKDRVKQWQKSAAMCEIPDDIDLGVRSLVSDGTKETRDDEGLNIKPQVVKRSSEKNIRDSREAKLPRKSSVIPRQERAAPKKHVRHDSHWMKYDVKKLHSKQNNLTQNNLPTVAKNPPLEKKIQDWIKRTDMQGEMSWTKPASKGTGTTDIDQNNVDFSKGASASHLGSSPHIQLSSCNQQKNDKSDAKNPTKIDITGSINDIQTNSYFDHTKEAKRASNVGDTLIDNEIQINGSLDNKTDGVEKVILERPSSISEQESGPKRNQKNSNFLETKQVTPKTPSLRKPLRHHKSCHQAESKMRNLHPLAKDKEEENKRRPLSTSPNQKPKNLGHKSAARSVSMSEVSFGNSAFSTLDLPLGAEANNLKKTSSKRNSNFVVPKVLKMVYNGSKKIAIDNAEPSKGSLSQPTSVESWLKKTSDPSVDTPALSETAMGESMCSNEKLDNTEEPNISIKDQEQDSSSTKSPTRHKNMGKSSKSFNSLEDSSCKGGSSASLKRTPAKRRKSVGKISKAMPLKESIITAFHGESIMKKPNSPSPYDYIGLKFREEEKVVSPIHKISTTGSNLNKNSYKVRDIKTSGKPSKKPNQNNLDSDDNYDEDENNFGDQDDNEYGISKKLPRWSAMQNYTHNLSTILSESASDTNSSKSQFIPEYLESNTTATQETINTMLTDSTIPPVSNEKFLKKRELKRRLTKHSDLISILSLSNTTEPENPGNIRPARSIRTYRKKNRTASTVDKVLILLAEEETLYMQELNTLVDGVIPVLLKCISNKNASGLFHSLGDHTTFLTQSIIDMGNALFSLRNHHKCIPLADAYALLIWASSAQMAYEDYMRAWRSGFEDIVVNLTPIESCPLGTSINEMKRDQNGDLLGERGEKIVVADLLRKPIIRIKHIHKALKDLNNFPQTQEESKPICSNYETLLEFRAMRIKEENARSIDQQAWSVETSRARNLWSLKRTNQLEINKNFQVIAKDCFSLEIPHSTGQRINCGVELVLRNIPGLDSEGDLLILKDDIKDPFLLFDPLTKKDLSARLGETREQVVVMVRDSSLGYLHAEFLILDTQDESIAKDWITIIGENPIPPPISRTRFKISPALESAISVRDADTASVMQILKGVETDKVTPLGERANEEEYASSSLTQESSGEDRDSSQCSDFADEVQGYFDKDSSPRMMAATVDSASTNRKIRTTKVQDHKHASTHEDRYAKVEQDLHEWKRYSKRGNGNPSQFTKYQKQKDTFKEMGQKNSTKNQSISPSPRPTISFPEDDAPPPPAHKSPVSGIMNNVPMFESPLPRGLTRRISSPLKHEYRPSLTSDGSFEATTDGDSNSTLLSEDKSTCDLEEDVSKVDENEVNEENEEIKSNYDSNSEAPFEMSSFIKTKDSKDTLPLDWQNPVENAQEKFIAVLSQWNPKDGKWLSLHSQACLVLITDGLIQCFEHEPSSYSPTDIELMKFGKALFKQILTPVVQVRQSTAIDIEINSPIIIAEADSSSLSQRSDTLRYRLFGPSACDDFYAAVHQSRFRNMEYLKSGEKSYMKKLESHAFDQEIGGSGRRRYLFGLGRRRSYRASTRARLENRGSGAIKSTSTALIAIQRFTGAGLFNISRSWVENSRWRGYHHRSSSSHDLSTYTGSSSYSGGGGLTTPPHSPTSQGGNSDSLYSSGLTVRNLGTTNILFRLYYMLRSGNWDDYGQAFLSVSLPPPDMKQKAPLYNGPQKRITITRSPIPVTEVVTSADVCKAGLMLDEVLGANLFVRMQKSGILLQTWEDVVSSEEDKGGSRNGDDNEHNYGAVRKFGSVAPRRHTWAMQFRRAGDAEWCWKLCRSGMP